MLDSSLVCSSWSMIERGNITITLAIPGPESEPPASPVNVAKVPPSIHDNTDDTCGTRPGRGEWMACKA